MDGFYGIIRRHAEKKKRHGIAVKSRDKEILSYLIQEIMST